uniref:Interleukin-6 n=1 Tax=Clarias magur TaxID=1594786 RepID=A0A6G6CA75_CLAMG|nr:interleukin 6 [Clarias magur]
MPSLLHYPGLLLLALLPLASLGLYSGDTDFYETSGVELQKDALAPDHKLLSIARQMRKDIASVGEQLKRDFPICLEHLSKYETTLMSSTVGCQNTDSCSLYNILRICLGLRVYQAYLQVMMREPMMSARMMDVKVGTTILLHLIKETVKVYDRVRPTSLPEDSAWNRKITTHSILYNFKDFMADTSRAINYLMIRIKTKHIAREEGWLLKHKQ